MANRLARETSPYLLQHAHNPVEWYPWGAEALARALDEDKPILLSIGYASCHWCHVMERESFQDPETAALMNEHFVSIKVDREERPDLDSVYMQGVQALTGHGGWPLTAFLTPDGRMFYGGTYFPPRPRHGLPSFRQVLTAVAEAFAQRRDEVERGSGQLLTALRRTLPSPHGEDASEPPTDRTGPGLLEQAAPEILDHAFQLLAGQFDPSYGGFGPPPKFPQPMILEFLLRYFYRSGRERALDMVLETLWAMARGGVRDHLGGGFHRYSVDARWLVPHFEKMLYDNALLARVYLHAYQATGDEECLEAATTTLDYLLTDLRAPEGGFYGSRDADSSGEEGLFYLWRVQEVDEVLGTSDGAFFRRAYGLTEEGNFEGRNILHLPHGLDAFAEAMGLASQDASRRLADARRALLEARREREPPARDEKVLTAWNAFALRALAEAGAALGREDYLNAARANGAFLLEALREDGRLLRSWKDGRAHVPGFLDDYAGLGNALLSLHETTLEPRWLHEGLALAEAVLDRFWDEEAGVFFDTARDAEALVVRPRNVMDNATPSGTSLGVELLLRSGHLLGREDYLERASRALTRELNALRRVPSAFGHLLDGLTTCLDPWLEITLVGDANDPLLSEMTRAAHSPYLPNRMVVGGDPSLLPSLPLVEGRGARDGRATAYVCRNMVCGAPIHEPEALAKELGGVAP